MKETCRETTTERLLQRDSLQKSLRKSLRRFLKFWYSTPKTAFPIRGPLRFWLWIGSLRIRFKGASIKRAHEPLGTLLHTVTSLLWPAFRLFAWLFSWFFGSLPDSLWLWTSESEVTKAKCPSWISSSDSETKSQLTVAYKPSFWERIERGFRERIQREDSERIERESREECERSHWLRFGIAKGSGHTKAGASLVSGDQWYDLGYDQCTGTVLWTVLRTVCEHYGVIASVMASLTTSLTTHRSFTTGTDWFLFFFNWLASD